MTTVEYSYTPARTRLNVGSFTIAVLGRGHIDEPGFIPIADERGV